MGGGAEGNLVREQDAVHVCISVHLSYHLTPPSLSLSQSLVDLAGSERHVATEARSQRTVEGANINRSLLALSSCISALVEARVAGDGHGNTRGVCHLARTHASHVPPSQGKRHIPYRNSKLTKLLKDSLGSDCRTSMIANVSPSSSALPETANTLHWADR